MRILHHYGRLALLAGWLLLILGNPGLPVTGVDAQAAACGQPVAILGADVAPGNQPEVLAALGVPAHALLLQETVGDERVQAHGLVPPFLLGLVAVSSVLFQSLPAGSGLHVQVNPHITLYTAQAYANALLTAGVTDASVGVAAPATQQSLGTTGLLSLLRAALVSCTAITTPRQSLAIREFVLTEALGQVLGNTAAPALMATLKLAATGTPPLSDRALEARIAQTAASQGTSVPAALSTQIIAYLHDLAASHAYAGIVARHPTIVANSPLQTTVQLGAAHGTPHIGHAAGILKSVAGTSLAVEQRDGVHRYQMGPQLLVYRNGAARTPAALQPGDHLQITYGSQGMILRIDATGTVAPGAVPQATAMPLASGTVTGTLAATVSQYVPVVALRSGNTIRSYPLAPQVVVQRNTAPIGLNALQVGDRLVLRLDASGRVIGIAASSTASSSASVPGALRDVLVPIGILGTAILLFLPLLVRRQRHPAGRHIPRAGRSQLRAPGRARASWGQMPGRIQAPLLHMAQSIPLEVGPWREAWRAPLAELVGTFFLTLAALVAGTPYAEALTLGVFVYVFGAISGSHLNPAVTIALAAARRLPAGRAVGYLVAQGGGAALARLMAPHVGPLAQAATSGAPAGEFLGVAPLLLAVLAVADQFTPAASSGVVIGAGLLAGLLTSKGILNPAIALAMGQDYSAALWAPVLGGLVFTGIFLLVVPTLAPVDAGDEQPETEQDENEDEEEEEAVEQEDPPRPTPRLTA